MAKKIKHKKEKNGLFSSPLVALVAFATIIGCSAMLIYVEKDCSKKRQELSTINARIDELKETNEKLQRDLDSEDISDYMESVAMEERGYAYPDEIRFYDASRD
ncbi:MAG: hypothetical protein J6L99_01645 [Ruminococcus sp.]|nr:hypothetical protein [Ruminococcus sp.]